MAKMDLVDIFKKRTRHPMRPRSSEYIDRLFPGFKKMDTGDGSLIAGTCTFMEKDLYVIGQQKPRLIDLKSQADLNRLNYGMLTSGDHSIILNILKKVRTSDPEKTYIFCMVDTYGADISMESARHFQAFFIAHLIREFITIPVRTISLVIGEGGSGGALAIQYTDIRGQMDDALYATAPPESTASILFRDAERINDALTILKPTAKELKKLGVIDRIVPSAQNVTNGEEMAGHVNEFLTKAIKDLSRQKIKKLLKKRGERAREFGLLKGNGTLHDIKRYIETPIKHFFRRVPPNIKIVNYSSNVEVGDDYGRTQDINKDQEFIECGGVLGKQNRTEGCGELIALNDFQKNFYVCPKCGYSYTLGAEDWIACLSDEGTFHELYRNITVEDLLESDSLTDYYRDFLKRQEGKSRFKESLVTGSARINHFQVVMAISEFYYCGGSMGVVFGEKFRRAIDYAIQERLPFISVCCSGGARLYEGISALMQMVKTIEAVERLKKTGLPYISILADPATGGAIASYAALGDITIAEPGALVIFTGPRVMESRGFPVDENLVRSQALHKISGDIYHNLTFYHEIRGIQEICERREMKLALTRYLELYKRTSGQKGKKGA